MNDEIKNEELTENQTNSVEPTNMESAPAAPTTPAPVDSGQAASTFYASFGRRFAAFFIDALLIGFVTEILNSILGIGGEGFNYSTSNPTSILGWIYLVYMTKTYGATLGKKAMHIRVQKVDGTELTWIDAVLREVIGKFVSGLVLFLGFLWAIWDPQKQAWHDKFANTVVVKE